MRNISSSSLAKLATNKGTEPITIVDFGYGLFSDREFPDLELKGKIVQVNNLEDVINISQSGSAQTVNVLLDASDGYLKSAFDNTDLHKIKCSIYQWFVGLPLDDKFLIFQGIIASPIVWKEGDRTLSFDVISQIEDQELGFSPEEGTFDFLPREMIGQAWPLIFGTVDKVPTVRIDRIPTGSNSNSGNVTISDGTRGGKVTPGRSHHSKKSVTKDSTGIHDPTLDPKITELDKSTTEASQLAGLYFIGYLQASERARHDGELDFFADISQGKGKFSSLAQQYLQLGNKFLLESQQIRIDQQFLKDTKAKQVKHEKSKLAIKNGKNLPQRRPLTLNIGGANHTGHMEGDTFVITSRIHPDAELIEGLPDAYVSNTYALDSSGDQVQTDTIPLITRNKFFFADAGAIVKIAPVQLSGTTFTDPETGLIVILDPDTGIAEEIFPPVRYIVSAAMNVQVLAVWAYRQVEDGTRQLVPVPTAYYEIVDVMFGELPTTMLYFPQPLSTQEGNWEDDIYATLKSPIGPNTVDIIIWIIQNFTSFDYDPATFATVHGQLDNYPSNFAILSKPSTLTTLQEIAFQSRCFIWLKNGLFYLKYLSIEGSTVETIRNDDILLQSLEVSCTRTEEIITKLVATWKPDYISGDFKIIFRHNVIKYGVVEKDFDFYIYNDQSLVEKSAIFWLIRLANTYKIINLKTTLAKLRIETFDLVNFDLSGNYACNGSIAGLIQGSNFDSNDLSVTLQAWLPVRLGEMVKYNFAYPGDLTIDYIFPEEKSQHAGSSGPGRKATNPTTPAPAKTPKAHQSFSSDTQAKDDTTTNPSQPGKGELRVTHRPYDWGPDPENVIDQGNQKPDILTQIDTTTIQPIGRPKDLSKYQYKQYDTKPKTVAKESDAGASTFPGKIVSGSGDTYQVDVYDKGLSGDPITVEVKQLQIDPDDNIPKDNWVSVMRLQEKDSSGASVNKYYMQHPVWIQES